MTEFMTATIPVYGVAPEMAPSRGLAEVNPELAGAVNAARSDLDYLRTLNGRNLEEAGQKRSNDSEAVERQFLAAEVKYQQAIEAAKSEFRQAETARDAGHEAIGQSYRDAEQESSATGRTLADAESLLKRLCGDYIDASVDLSGLEANVAALQHRLGSTAETKSAVDEEVKACRIALVKALDDAERAQAQEQAEATNLHHIEKMSINLTVEESSSAQLLYDQVSERLEANRRACYSADEAVRNLSREHTDLGLESLGLDEEIDEISKLIANRQTAIAGMTDRLAEIEARILRLKGAISEIDVSSAEDTRGRAATNTAPAEVMTPDSAETTSPVTVSGSPVLRDGTGIAKVSPATPSTAPTATRSERLIAVGSAAAKLPSLRSRLIINFKPAESEG